MREYRIPEKEYIEIGERFTLKAGYINTMLECKKRTNCEDCFFLENEEFCDLFICGGIRNDKKEVMFVEVKE